MASYSYKKCTKCKGTGTVWRKERQGSQWSRVEYPTQCTKCLGSGKVLKDEKVPNVWPFGPGQLLGSRSTTYHVKSGRKKTGTGNTWKGYKIYKTDSGYEVPGIEKGTEFDSVRDAKKFINFWTKKGMQNPSMAKSKRRKNNGASANWIPCHAIRTLPSGDIQLLTEAGTMSNPGKRKSFLNKVQKTFGKIVKRGKGIIK